MSAGHEGVPPTVWWGGGAVAVVDGGRGVVVGATITGVVVAGFTPKVVTVWGFSW